MIISWLQKEMTESSGLLSWCPWWAGGLHTHSLLLFTPTLPTHSLRWKWMGIEIRTAKVRIYRCRHNIGIFLKVAV